MTFNEVIDRAVREAAQQGLVVNDIVLPLLNMAASVLANAVTENKLDAAEEIELLTARFEALYEEYLVAYVKQDSQDA